MKLSAPSGVAFDLRLTASAQRPKSSTTTGLSASTRPYSNPGQTAFHVTGNQNLSRPPDVCVKLGDELRPALWMCAATHLRRPAVLSSGFDP
jgi:hypothetical protein